MKSVIKKATAFFAAAVLIAGLTGCSKKEAPKTEGTKYKNAQIIELNESSAKIGGKEIEIFDYTWHCDPSQSHDDNEDAPAEYYTGTKPQTDSAAYIDSELYYFPKLPQDGFKKIRYDGEYEWAYYYTDGEHDDYIFATLPALDAQFPTAMMHSQAEVSENKVLHITRAGTYVLNGKWNGQINVDLGDEDTVFTDENAKVTLVLNGADIKCTVAPGIVFTSVYECDNDWKDADEHTADVDLSDAGAQVIVADGTDNSVSGCNVFRMLKTKYKDDDSDEEIKLQKKMRKTDGALYSYMSMTISGEEENTGKLKVTSCFEGIDSELHLAFNGGNITVESQDDGINVNEDNVSVVYFNSGDITLNAAQGAEGDGVDSNGFVVINGGTLSVNGVTAPDSAIDSEDGIHYNAGKIVIDGKEQRYTAGSVFNETGRENGEMPKDSFMPADEEFDIKEFKEKVAALDDDATFDDVMKILGADNRGTGGMGKPEGEPPEIPDGQPPQMQNGGMPPEKPEGNQ